MGNNKKVKYWDPIKHILYKLNKTDRETVVDFFTNYDTLKDRIDKDRFELGVIIVDGDSNTTVEHIKIPKYEMLNKRKKEVVSND